MLCLQHGLQKCFGLLGGDQADNPVMWVAGSIELLAGTAIAIGFQARWAAFLASGLMAVAYFTSWAPMGFWVSFSPPNFVASIQNCFLFLFLSAAGPGLWSLDRALKRRRERTGSAP